MAFQDNDYVKAPYLQAGDSLKITGTTSGFSIKAGTTGFIYGTNGGTLTMGEEGVPTSIPTLNINAREINWNGRPLGEYFASAGGSSDGLNALSSRVDNLQTQLTTEITELRETDEVFTSEIEDLRLKSLGASVNILQNTLNNYASNICGIVIPVSLIQGEMSSFNTIRLGGIRNDINCYVSIYHSISVTPSVNNQFTLLHKDATLVAASGTDSQQASVDIRLSKNVALPTSGVLLILFATSSSAPSSTGLDWIIDNSVEANLKLSVYAIGPSNPTSSNGVWLFQKRPNPMFVTFVPDIQIIFTGHADDAALHVDSELRRKIDDLESSSADYMTEAETKSAIAAYSSVGGNSNLGTLVTQLTTSQQYSLVKGGTQLRFNTSGMYLSADTGSTAMAELSFTTTGITALINKNSTGISGLYLDKYSTGLSYSKKASDTDSGSTVAQLVLSPGKVNMQLVDSSVLQGRYGFNLNASLPIYDSGATGVYMTYYSRSETELGSYTSSIGMNGYQAELQVGTSSNHMSLHLTPDAFRIESSGSPWNGLIGTSSHAIPTVSVVHYLIQSALANQ